MTIDEFKRINNLNSDEDMRLFFLNNLHNNCGIVALTCCPRCHEILDNLDIEVTHNCHEEIEN